MIGNTQPFNGTLTPAKGGREFSVPGDPATFTGNTGIQFNNVLGATEVLLGLPLAAANSTGAVYYSAIHGGLGSDARNPAGLPAAGYNPNKPAFPNPEVTGYYLPPNPLFTNQAQNGYSNTEKILRSPSDNPAGNGTIWQELQGRTRLNFQLWISEAGGVGTMHSLELYRDLNLQDKSAGNFGVGTGPLDLQNAMLVAQWVAPNAQRNQPQPNFATNGPFDIPAGCNLYLLYRNLNVNPGNLAIGSIWFS